MSQNPFQMPTPIQYTAMQLKSEFPGSFSITLPFSTQTTFTFQRPLGTLKWTNSKSVYIDNGNNPNEAVVYFPSTRLTIRAPSYSQGFYPVISGGGNLEFQASSSGGVDAEVIFFNIPMEFYNWSTVTPGSIVGTVTVTGTVTTNPLAVTTTNRGGALVTGGTSQQIMAANGARKGLLIENPATIASQNVPALESLFVNFGGAATINGTDSFELTPGGFLQILAPETITSTIHVNAATTGHQFIAKEFV